MAARNQDEEGLIVLEAQGARAAIDPSRGGRIVSLRVDGLELLVAPVEDPIHSGCFPMAPFAGRVRRGRFSYAGQEHSLARNMPPHAIHGTTFDRPWEELGMGHIAIPLGPGWPFPGHAEQHFHLDPKGLDLRLGVYAGETPFPASAGWHPWLRRELARGEPAQLHFDAARMYRRDAAGIPDGVQVAPPAGPWDDCFTGLAGPPVVVWPGALRLTLTSDATHLVIYNEPEHALCVEPMSGPPDALNLEPRIVAAGRPLTLRARLSWERLAPGAEAARDVGGASATSEASALEATSTTPRGVTLPWIGSRPRWQVPCAAARSGGGGGGTFSTVPEARRGGGTLGGRGA